MQGNLHITVSALLAGAVVWMSELPARLNPVILPLMASIKREQVIFTRDHVFCERNTSICFLLIFMLQLFAGGSVAK